MREEIKHSLYRYMIRKNISPENVKDTDISLWTLFNDVRNEDSRWWLLTEDHFNLNQFKAMKYLDQFLKTIKKKT